MKYLKRITIERATCSVILTVPTQIREDTIHPPQLTSSRIKFSIIFLAIRMFLSSQAKLIALTTLTQILKFKNLKHHAVIERMGIIRLL
jgi:hypothetical protein